MKWVQDLFTYKDNPRERSEQQPAHRVAQGYFGLIKSVVRFEKWDAILDGKTIALRQAEQNAWRHWAIGLAYLSPATRTRPRPRWPTCRRIWTA